jgi:hypothetical protein
MALYFVIIQHLNKFSGSHLQHWLLQHVPKHCTLLKWHHLSLRIKAIYCSLKHPLNSLYKITIKFANSSPCACYGSSGQKPQHGLMMLAYQRFTAVLLLLIYGSLFLSGIYYCLSVFWCAVTRMLELELEQRTNIKEWK